jgi:hypothetical protein
MLTFMKAGNSALMGFLKFSLIVLRTVLYKIVTVQLRYRTICARWVPRMLIEEDKWKCMGAVLSLLECYHRDVDKFLDHIVTGDATWASHYAPESD